MFHLGHSFSIPSKIFIDAAWYQNYKKEFPKLMSHNLFIELMPMNFMFTDIVFTRFSRKRNEIRCSRETIINITSSIST